MHVKIHSKIYDFRHEKEFHDNPDTLVFALLFMAQNAIDFTFLKIEDFYNLPSGGVIFQQDFIK